MVDHNSLPASRNYKMADRVEGKKNKKSKGKGKHKKKRKSLSESVEHPSKAIKTDEDSEENNSSGGRQFTVSVALPGSILDNAQSPELRTYLAGQLARALVVFNVDEIVIFNESGKASNSGMSGGFGQKTDANTLLARILQYLECPQYLRKSFFPKHPDLQYAGVLNPLDSPHHMRVDDKSPYREGVVLNRPTKPGWGSLVNCGMRKEVKIDRSLNPGVRVTVKINNVKPDAKTFSGTVVAPSAPRTEIGMYWGYTVRLAPTFGAVFTQCPYKDGYDVTLGTSERGSSVDNLVLTNFRHLLLVFGGLKGLEASLESDETLNVSDPALLFHHYINTCPGQGSRTIRTEEALLVTMSAMRPAIEKATEWTYDGHNFVC